MITINMFITTAVISILTKVFKLQILLSVAMGKINNYRRGIFKHLKNIQLISE